MSSSVRTSVRVIGEPEPLAEAFEGDPGRWLPDARRDGPSHWSLVIRLGSLHHTVRAEVGEPWRAGTTRGRRLAWEPITPDGDPGLIDHALPSLEGEIGLHEQPDGGCTLIMDAWYSPPGGAIGAAADAVALHPVARRTVDTLLQAIAERLRRDATGDA